MAQVGVYDLLVPGDRAWAFRTTRAYYERSVVHWVVRVAARLNAPIAYDIGANSGFYSLLLAQQARRVFAFEPVDETFKALEENLRRNDIANVVPLQYGISDRSGSCLIKVYTSSGNNSISVELPADADATFVRNELIQIKTIDDLIAEGAIDPPDVMKIDVEGSELAAIRGARLTIHDARPVIVAEHNGDLPGFDPGAQQEVIDTLLAEDYVVYGLVGDRDLTLHPLEGFGESWVGNLVAAPVEQQAVLRP
jgi:FkbM family methyltransferase